MGHRDAIPLYKTRHVAFVETILESDKRDRAIASHLSIGTGARGGTIIHTHSSWFTYNASGDLYYKIPKSEPCRQNGQKGEPCCECDGTFEPKTPAAEGRRILISNNWINPVTGEQEYFGLRDAVEDYFAISNDRSPEDVSHGNKMIDGDGISLSSLNTWIRDIAADSAMSGELREERLREEIDIEYVDDDDNDRKLKQIKERYDSDGNKIPDLTSHDLRATFCTQLMRNDILRSKAIKKTGHKHEETLSTYVSFAEGEIDAAEEDLMY
ncbi:MAG: hypothetical protein ABEI52_12110 [Halobacteriaceae archaeon]